MIRRRGLRRAVATVPLICVTLAAPPRLAGQISPAGDTGAVLSFIDAADGRVEIVRHWPQAPVDVDVYPFVPYFWDGCLGPGAILMLVTGPPLPGGRAVDSTVAGAIPRIGIALAHAPSQSSGGTDELAQLRRLALTLRTPGDPVREAAKAVAAPIADLASYERRGYAVFAFVTWQGWRCGVTFRAVPEGYGIPFVR
jgi:hypothetical protein